MMKYLCLNIKKPIKFLVAGKCVFDEEWMHYERILDEYALFIPISGALYLNVGNIDESLLPGDIYLINARTRHFGWKSSPVTFYWFHFNLDDAKILETDDIQSILESEKDKGIIYFPFKSHIDKMENFLILINQLIHSYKSCPINYYNDYLATTLLLEIYSQALTYLTRSTNQFHRRLNEIVAYIEGNYREDLRVSEIAHRFGYNEKYLVRLFRQEMNNTIKGYIINTRLTVAQSLLLNTQKPISTIAKESGFSDEFYFMQRFKKKFGISPSKYRNTYHLQVLSRY